MPENTVYVGRPTKWGNPFKLIGDEIFIDISWRSKFTKWRYVNLGCNEDLVQLYESLFENSDHGDMDFNHWSEILINQNIRELSGKNLACFCSLNVPCHADVLLRLCNSR